MKIGELAKHAGVGVQTVRYYERRDLLPPPDRTSAGYREYSEQDLHRLRFVLRSKDLGFTLAEITELLELRVDPERTADDVRERALIKIETTRSKIRDLKNIERALRRLVDRCHAHGPAEECALIHAIEHEADFHTEGEEHHEHA